MRRIQKTMTMNLSRRRFLQSTAASCMASTLPLLAQEPAKARKLRKAVMLGTVRVKTDTLLEKFKAIKEAGFVASNPMATWVSRK